MTKLTFRFSQTNLFSRTNLKVNGLLFRGVGQGVGSGKRPHDGSGNPEKNVTFLSITNI